MVPTRWRLRSLALLVATLALLVSTSGGWALRAHARSLVRLSADVAAWQLAVSDLDGVVARSVLSHGVDPGGPAIAAALARVQAAAGAVAPQLPSSGSDPVWSAEAAVEGWAGALASGGQGPTRQQWDSATADLTSGLTVLQAATVTQARSASTRAERWSLALHAGAAVLIVLLLGAAEAVVRRDRRTEAEALRAREARFRSLIANAADGIVLLDSSARITYASASVQRLLGPERAIVGSAATDWLTGPEADRLAEALADARELPEARHSIEVQVPATDGTRVVEVRITNRLTDPDVAALVLNLRDMTAAVAARQQLRHHQRLTQDLLDSTPAGVFIRDLAGRFTLVNRGFEAIVAAPRDEILGRTVTEVLPDQWHSQALEHDEILRRTGTPLTRQVVLVQDSGMHVYLLSRFLLCDEHGEAYGLGGIFTDITEQATRAAEQSWFTTVVETASEAMLSIDPTTRIEHWNAAAARMFGYSPTEAIGASATMLWDAHSDTRRAALARVLAGDTLTLPGVRARHKDGHIFHATVTATPLSDSSGASSGAALIIRPTTTDSPSSDPVTGLPTLAALTAEMETSLVSAGAVIILGVHRMDLINTTRGHSIGDAVLSTVAEALTARLIAQPPGPSTADPDPVGSDGSTTAAPSDDATRPPRTLLARGHGGRFIVVAPHAGAAETARALAFDLIETARVTVEVGPGTLVPTVSAGIAELTAGSDPQAALAAASLALKEAKARGGGQALLHDPQMTAAAAAQLELVADLRQAEEAGQLCLHYQPIVDLRTGLVTGVEALMRWHHPRLGSVPPDVFIPLAESNDLIHALGYFGLCRALSEARSWSAPELPELTGLHVAVNVSAREVARPDFAATVLSALAEADLEPSRLTVELTETTMLETVDGSTSANDQLEALRADGVRVALDDFGTGYASLAYLNRLPVDVLKIDRSFVAGIHEPTDHRTITTSMVTLGRTLGLDIVAEGIEDEAAVDTLTALGATHGQGYWWSRPVPASDLAEVVAEIQARSGATRG